MRNPPLTKISAPKAFYAATIALALAAVVWLAPAATSTERESLSGSLTTSKAAALREPKSAEFWAAQVARRIHARNTLRDTQAHTAENNVTLTAEQRSALEARGYLLANSDDTPLDQLLAETQTGAMSDVARYANALMDRGERDAEAWLVRAAALGSTEALLRLAKLASLSAGDSAHNRRMAAEWLAIASLRGDPLADAAAHAMGVREIVDSLEGKAQERLRWLEHERMRYGFGAFEQGHSITISEETLNTINPS